VIFQDEVIFMAENLLRSIKMVDRQTHSLKLLPMANYSSAIARAVEWLGDRYLLAKPINAVPEQSMKSGRHGDVGARARRAE
jgi:hypothetical protein